MTIEIDGIIMVVGGVSPSIVIQGAPSLQGERDVIIPLRPDQAREWAPKLYKRVKVTINIEVYDGQV